MSMLRELLSLTGSGAGNSRILTGLGAPDNSIGTDGDVYFKLEFVVDGFAADEAYVVANTTQVLSKHSDTFKKTYDSPAICVEWRSNSSYGPMLVGLTKDSVKYTRNTSDSGIKSYVIDGVTWYISDTQYWDSSTDSPTIPTLYDYPSMSDKKDRLIAILQASHAEAVTGYVIKDAWVKTEGSWTKRYVP